MSKTKSITANCRYLDAKRRVYIPPAILEKAHIPVGTMLEFEVQNNCLIAKQVIGITVLDHNEKGKLVKKGR